LSEKGVTATGHGNSTVPLTSDFRCRTNGNFEIH